jgi:hypothetical protein
MTSSLPNPEFVSTLGCTLRLDPAPPHLGDGMILSGIMRQPGDGRRFEVYLSRQDIERLVTLLEGPLTPPPPRPRKEDP